MGGMELSNAPLPPRQTIIPASPSTPMGVAILRSDQSTGVRVTTPSHPAQSHYWPLTIALANKSCRLLFSDWSMQVEVAVFVTHFD